MLHSQSIGSSITRRRDWDVENKLHDTAPLGQWFATSINGTKEPYNGSELTSVVRQYDASKSATTYTYLAELAMLQCVVAADDLLTVNVLEEAADSQTLWTKLSSFLGLTTQVREHARYTRGGRVSSRGVCVLRTRDRREQSACYVDAA